MTKDNIIKLAREAGFIFGDPFGIEEIERFATLIVANINPKSFISWQEGYEAGVVAEREACAKVCDAINAKHIESYGNYLGDTYAVECAAAIRARGTT